MRDQLEAVLELFGGMPPGGQQHWRERSLPSIKFESDDERREFLDELGDLEKDPEPLAGPPERTSSPGTEGPFLPGQRVNVNLAGWTAEGVAFSQNVEVVPAVVQHQNAEQPSMYRVKLLISFRGVTEFDLPAERIWVK